MATTTNRRTPAPKRARSTAPAKRNGATEASQPVVTPYANALAGEGPAREKLVQYLTEAHSTELALVRTLQAHISITPKGAYRSGLERHLEETKDHAERVERRLAELGQTRNIVELGVGVVQGVVAQVLALSKGPYDMVRGGSGEEKLLKNAKDESATEALEIATYNALEQLARRLGDTETAELAADIRKDEEAMLEALQQEIPRLTDAVVRAEVNGDPSYDVSETGAADFVREAGRQVRRTGEDAATRAKTTARQARKVPGVAVVEGEVKGALADESDLAIANYGSLTVDQIVAQLDGLSQIDLAKVDAFERRHKSRSNILERVAALQSTEPWPGYDDQGIGEIVNRLGDAPEDLREQVRSYEREHKSRTTVLRAAEPKA